MVVWDSSIDIFTFGHPWVACLKQRAGNAIIYKPQCPSHNHMWFVRFVAGEWYDGVRVFSRYCPIGSVWKVGTVT